MESLPRKQLDAHTIRAWNRRIVTLMSYYLNLAPGAIDLATVTEIADGSGVSREYAYAELLAAICDLDTLGADRDFFRNYFLPMLHELDPASYENDPYYRTIHTTGALSGNWEWKSMTLATCECFVCRDFVVTGDRRLIPQIGYFTRPFVYPAMLEGGREWMTLMPNETVTTQPAVRRAHGKVLTYGLGLGYFAFMASEKDNVSSVTVVERSADVIALFERHILPQFPHAEKIRIIAADAFAYAASDFAGEGYDFVFADIWHDVGDGRDLYLRFKQYESLCPTAEYVYWLEDTILCYLDKSLW